MPQAKIREEQILNFNADVIAAPITGYVSGSGTVAATDTLLQAIQKLNGNDALKVPQTTTVAGFALSGNVTLANLSASTGITGGTYNGSTAASFAIDQTFTPTWTGLHTHNFNAIGTATTTDAVLYNNTTASTAGSTTQNTPAIHLSGTAWGTTLGTSQAFDFRIVGVGVTATSGYGRLTFLGSINGGGYSSLLTVDSFGSFIAKSTFFSQISNIATTSTDGLVYQNTTSSTSGVPVQYSGRTRFQGRVWNTTPTAADNIVDFIEECRPISSATPTANLFWSYRLSTGGSGAFTDLMSLNSNGNLTLNVLGSKFIGVLSYYQVNGTQSVQNTTATLTASQLATGVIKVTSTTAVTLTLPTASSFATQIGGVAGTWVDFVIDNSASTSSGAVTVAVNTGITTGSVITGGTTLTLAIGTVGHFRLYFTSTSAAILARLA